MKRVVWCYGIHQLGLIIELHAAGYETQTDILSMEEIQLADIIVFDDLLQKNKNSEDVTFMILLKAHHKPCIIIFITQSLGISIRKGSAHSQFQYASLRFV